MSPMEIGTGFPVRKTRKQKTAFRQAVKEYALEQGYHYQEEKGPLGSVNVVMGDPDKADYLITAHYDTCVGLLYPNLITPCNVLYYLLYQILVVACMILIPAVPAFLMHYLASADRMTCYLIWYGLFLLLFVLMLFGPANKHNANDNTSGVVTVLEIMRSFPEPQRDKVCFVLFDLEESGLIGSGAYRKRHKSASNRQLVLNLDCVGDGDHLLMIPTSGLKKVPGRLAQLKSLCGEFGDKELLLRDKGLSVYPSDQKHFPLGVGICALRKGPLGLYMSRIHTRRDTILEETNVNILRSALTSLITCAANKKG